MNIYQPVEAFEKAIAEYCGAPYAILVNSCTNALLLACAYNNVKEVTIPSHTYIGVPMSIIHAGGTVKFRDSDEKYENDNWTDVDWQEYGYYGLAPYPIVDSARLLTSGLYVKIKDDMSFFGEPFVCISLHWGKTLNLGQGGVILHSDPEAQEWFKRARFDGRTPGVHPRDDNPILGWHCYMSPSQAAEALTRLHFLSEHNDPLPPDDYPDLSKMEVFK